jgi:hypothetical protein
MKTLSSVLLPGWEEPVDKLRAMSPSNGNLRREKVLRSIPR